MPERPIGVLDSSPGIRQSALVSADLSRDRDGRTELHHAALQGPVGVAQHLIEVGSDINAQDRQGSAPLHFAAQGFQLDVARALLAAGASTTVQNVYGNTALWTATFNSRGRGELIIELLAHGAEPDSLNNSGASPRTLAATIENYDVAQFFEDPR